MADTEKLYEEWLDKAVLDPDLIKELKSVEGKTAEIEDRFYKSLEFGTGGLRGVIGAGTNRMNVYTVGQATQGLANYLNKSFDSPSVAIGYDSRIKSRLFAETAAGVLASNGIKVYIFPQLEPTPLLSFAVRRLHCSSGIVITASHNPSKYNGYKCYGEKGYQMTDEAAAETLEEIKKVDIFSDVKFMNFEDALASDMVDFIEDWLINEFYDKILEIQPDPGICEKSGIKILYTPLNGTGNIPVKTILKKIGVKDLRVVLSQENPDGTFPTCPFPNPEIKQVFEEGFKIAKTFPADLIVATDPDCDRIGIAVRHDGEYKLMTGNEVGCMLTQYLLMRRKEKGTLPKDPAIVKTIVTSELIRFIANDYGGKTYDFLTGFKYIGEFLEKLVEAGEEDRFILGMEESYGYLSGAHARDKDAVNGAMIVVEMAAYYKTIGKDLTEVMDEIYSHYGMYLNSLLNFGFEGETGMKKMSEMMENLRNSVPESIGGLKVLNVSDYKLSVSTDTKTGKSEKIGLPKSNVLSYSLEGNSKIIIRPSGTEPKIKIYVTAVAENMDSAQKLTEKLSESIESIMGLEKK